MYIYIYNIIKVRSEDAGWRRNHPQKTTFFKSKERGRRLEEEPSSKIVLFSDFSFC